MHTLKEVELTTVNFKYLFAIETDVAHRERRLGGI
jgi:hypothetical protein